MKNFRHLFIFFTTILDSILLCLFGMLAYGVSFPGRLQTLIFSYDNSVAGIIAEHSPQWFVSDMNILTYLADPVVMIFFAVIVLIVLVHIHEEVVGALLTGAMIIGGLLSLAIKEIVLRARPNSISPVSLHVLSLIDRFGSSFPSAHALVSIIFYGFLAHTLGRVYSKTWQRTVVYAAAVFMIGGIGYSRIVIGAHWFSDVVAGWLLGGAVLGTLIIALYRVEEWHAKKEHPSHSLVIVSIAVAASCITFLAVFDLMRYTL